MRPTLALICLLLLAPPLPAQEKEKDKDKQKRKRPKGLTISLYQPAPAKLGLRIEHQLVKQRYQVRLTIEQRIIAVRPEDPRPWLVYRFEAPEAGAFGKVRIQAGLLQRVKTTRVKRGFEVDLIHRDYRPPSSNKLENAPLRSDELIALSDALIMGCFPKDRRSALARSFRSQLRSSRAAFARSVLYAFCLTYENEDPQKVLRLHPLKVWRYLARLLKTTSKGDLKQQIYPAIRQAICGVRVVQTYTPQVLPGQTHRQANPVNLRSGIGRAVLVGRIGGENQADWWRVQMRDPDDPVLAKRLPKGLTWVRVHVREKGFRGCYLRVHGKAPSGASYRLEVTNKSGKSYQWIEVHERPSSAKKLPY